MTTPALHLGPSEPPPSTSPSPPPLPPPSTFDILPPLHQLLSRLLAQSSTIPGPDGEAQPGSATISNDPNVLTYQDLQPLEIQHLAGEIGAIKTRVQKARAEVKKLPDVDRTVEEQGEEIEALEEKCRLLREALAGMAARARSEDAANRRHENGEGNII